MPLDLPALFGRQAPVLLEIGFGMGDATAELAAADPGRDVLAVDIHTPGQGNLLKLLDARGLTNVRVARRRRAAAAARDARYGVAGRRAGVLPGPVAQAAAPQAPAGRRRVRRPGRRPAGRRRRPARGDRHAALRRSRPARCSPGTRCSSRCPRPGGRRTKFEQRGRAAGRPAHDLAAAPGAAMLTASVTFALAAALIVLLPGPDTLVVLRNLVRGGRRRAALTVAGVLCGLTVVGRRPPRSGWPRCCTPARRPTWRCASSGAGVPAVARRPDPAVPQRARPASRTGRRAPGGRPAAAASVPGWRPTCSTRRSACSS